MKKQRILVPLLASLMLAPITASADYYRYVDELRKPGQSVEEAKREQESAYREAMEKKYANIRQANSAIVPLTKEERVKIKAQHKKLERKILAQRLDLTDTQQSKLEELHQEMMSFMGEKRAEIAFYKAVKEQEFMEILTDEQKEKFQTLRSAGSKRPESKSKKQ